MATKKLPRFVSEVDRKVAKEVANDFLKLVVDGVSTRKPADVQAKERRSLALSLTDPKLRAAFIEFWTRQRYGRPTRRSSKTRKAQANSGAEARS
jgi:hypothetical protein